MPEVKTKKSNSKDIEENKVVAALSYFWILCLIPLLTKRDSKFVQFHAKQGLVLFGIEILGTFVYWVPLFGWSLALLFFVVSVMGAIKTLNGEEWEIPYIYDWSKKINL